MSLFPPRSEWKAIHLPSGEKFGKPLLKFSKVNCLKFCPFVRISQISDLLPLPITKASHCRSCEIAKLRKLWFWDKIWVASSIANTRLTPRGIEFTIKTSRGFHTIRDTTSNISANTYAFYEFVWNQNVIDDFLVRMILQTNGVVTASGNPPIADDSIRNLNFYVLNTPFGYNNMECIIKRLVIYNDIPENIKDEFWSSSSSSVSSISSESS